MHLIIAMNFDTLKHSSCNFFGFIYKILHFKPKCNLGFAKFKPVMQISPVFEHVDVWSTRRCFTSTPANNTNKEGT